MPIITPVDRPAASSDQPSQSAKSARQAAIDILSGKGPGSPQAPVSNPSQVTPEEMSAIKAPSTPETLGQKPTSERPSEPKEATEEKEEPLSSQYAVLARKEKALRARAQQQEAAIKAREEALVAREAALAAKDTEYQSNYIPKNRLLEDTLGVLAEAGIDYEQLTQLALNPPPKQDPATKAYIAKLEAQINKINGTLEEQQKTAKDTQTQAYQSAVKQITSDVSKLVESNEDFETVRSVGPTAVKEIVKLIEKTFQEDGYVMDYAQAAKEVEDHLTEKYLEVAQLKKIQARLNGNKAPEQQKAPEPAPQLSTELPASSKPLKTLTNSVGVTRQLSARERAILAMKGELK